MSDNNVMEIVLFIYFYLLINLNLQGHKKRDFDLGHRHHIRLEWCVHST